MKYSKGIARFGNGSLQIYYMRFWKETWRPCRFRIADVIRGITPADKSCAVICWRIDPNTFKNHSDLFAVIRTEGLLQSYHALVGSNKFYLNRFLFGNGMLL